MRTMPEALAAPTVVTFEVAKLVTPELDVLLVRVPEALAPVAPPLVELVEVTAEARALGRPVAAEPLETAPLLVAMMRGA